MAKIYQIGILPAFLNGIYEGDISFEYIQTVSNFGLGTVNGLKGELVALDGVFYQIDEFGKASLVNPKNSTPFALVSQFDVYKTLPLENIQSLNNLKQTLLNFMETQNIFYMFRIDGIFTDMHIRSENCKYTTHQSLGELLPAIQKKQTLKKTEGTLVGSFCPSYSKSLTIENFHFHYINQERTLGGHVFDLDLEKAKVQMQKSHELMVHAFQTTDFYQCDLEVDITSELKKIE
jgi:acetolactate decarboxylase